MSPPSTILTKASLLQESSHFASLLALTYLAQQNAGSRDVCSSTEVMTRIREESIYCKSTILVTIDDGRRKIIKEHVKKEVSKIIPKVEKFVNDRLESEVLVRSSKEANSSHAVAANLSELELKKILIDKMETNNSINRTLRLETDRGPKEDGQKETPLLPCSKVQRQTKTAGTTTGTGSKTHTISASQSAPVGEAMQSTEIFERSADQEFETGIQDEQEERRVSNKFLVPELCTKATTEKLDWINPEGRQYPHDLRQPLPLIPNSQALRESARDVYSKRRIIAVTKVEIVEWHDYKHLDWITVRRDDDALYKFKEGDFHRLRIQDIEDI
ncbi:hypothetical protein Tco_0365063 [Tanacetum coccineum]